MAWGLQFGEHPLRAAPWIALAPLVAIGLAAPRPGLTGWLHGVATWVVALSWIAPTLTTYGQLPRPLSAILLLVLAIGLGVFHALAARAIAGLRGGPAIVQIAGSAAIWVALEWLRSRSAMGFPWNLAAHAAIDSPGALDASRLLGVWGVSGLVALSGAGVAVALLRRDPRPALATLLLAATVLPIAGRLADAPAPVRGHERALAVRIIQPNVPNLVEWDPLRAEAGYRQVVEQSLLACDEPGALVVWPESAAWPRSVGDARLDADIARILARGCALLVNSATHEEGRWYNSVWLFRPGGPPQRADKRHLVPFGEYVPLGELIPFVGRLARNAGDFSPASELRLLDLGGERLGVAICFEVVFPAETAELVQAGATMLVTVTNDAWYGDTAAPWQHLASARFRAAETARPLLRAAITGVSALVDPRGRVVEQLGVERRGTIRARVVGSTLSTPAARWPWLGPLLALTVAAWTLLAGRRSRRLASDQQPPAA